MYSTPVRSKSTARGAASELAIELVGESDNRRGFDHTRHARDATPSREDLPYDIHPGRSRNDARRGLDGAHASASHRSNRFGASCRIHIRSRRAEILDGILPGDRTTTTRC
jgi:hypothetical protein